MSLLREAIRALLEFPGAIDVSGKKLGNADDSMPVVYSSQREHDELQEKGFITRGTSLSGIAYHSKHWRPVVIDRDGFSNELDDFPDALDVSGYSNIQFLQALSRGAQMHVNTARGLIGSGYDEEDAIPHIDWVYRYYDI